MDKNPIEKRLDILMEHWNAFAENKDARMLCFLIAPDEAEMLDAFFRACEEDVIDTPDHWIRFTDGFPGTQPYGLQLRSSLQAYFNSVKEDLTREGIPAAWACPPVKPREQDFSAFYSACASFQEYYKDRMAVLAVILTPAAVSDTQALQRWLYTLLSAAPSPAVRFVVMDYAQNPLYHELCDAEKLKIVTVKPELAMNGALAEIAESGGPGPDGTFRKLFVSLIGALSKNDLPRAEKTAAECQAIAVKEHWHNHAAAVCMALAGGYAAGRLPDMAITQYRSAGGHAQEALKNNDRAGAKLLIQAECGEAGMLFAQKKYPVAAEKYLHASTVAQEQKELLLACDCLRMTGFCHEMNKQYRIAWEYLVKALQLGETMDTDTRQQSSLPFVGQSMLRIVKRDDMEWNARQIDQRMTTLLGPEWREPVEGGRE